jgi:uncharacterized protein (TIGR02246 family)
MKGHLLAAASLAIGLILPALANEKNGPCTGPEEACRKIVESTEIQVAAFARQDAATIASLYAKDAVFVTEGPILSGREAIEKFYAEGFKSGDSGLVLHIAESRIMGDLAWAIGEWNLMSAGKPLHGNWVTLFVPDGEAWKMRVDTFNVIEPSPK